MDRIQLSRPSITDEEVRAAERVLRSGYLVNGPEARAFEEELAAACGRRHAAVVSSGTAALHLALHALWAREAVRAEEAEVPSLLVPGFTFPATANVAAFLPFSMPVTLCDVESDSFCAPADAIARHLAAGCGPAMVVHQFGYPAPLPDPALLGERARLLISDAACAVAVPGAMRGAAVCLSFHPRKLLTTGEGGAVLSDDEGLIDEIRRLRAHGMVARPGQEIMDEPQAGLNYRLGEVGAAVGRVQLRRLPGLVAAHRERALRYRERLAVHGGLAFQADAPGRVFQTLAVVLPEGVDRAALRGRLRERGIETQIASYALHRLEAFASARVRGLSAEADELVPASAASLPVCERLHLRGLALPLHADLTLGQVDAVAEALLGLLPAAA